MRTDRGAPNGQLVAVDLRQHLGQAEAAPRPEPSWQTVVPEAKDTLVGATAVGGRFILRYLRDASTLVRVHGADGQLQRELAAARRGHGHRLRRPLG